MWRNAQSIWHDITMYFVFVYILVEENIDDCICMRTIIYSDGRFIRVDQLKTMLYNTYEYYQWYKYGSFYILVVLIKIIF